MNRNGLVYGSFNVRHFWAVGALISALPARQTAELLHAQKTLKEYTFVRWAGECILLYNIYFDKEVVQALCSF